MAINTLEFCDKNIPPPLINVLGGLSKATGSVRVIKPNFDDDSVKRGRTRKKKGSPYLNGEKLQLISRITEKKVQKKNEIFSSFPLATNIYRASSDEFKALKKMRQKARKSVLTLPNVPAPIPKTCTVSDMNDSDYYNNKNEKKYKVSPPRSSRFLHPNRKMQSARKGFEFYDRDAHHYECSSHDMLLKNGDGKVTSRSKRNTRDDMQDVWSVLRNINKFQFRPTPRISDEDSLTSNRKKTFTKKFITRKGRRLIGTCRTEEVAYVADFELRSKTSASRSSSFDRVTVIDKSDFKSAIKLDKQIAKPHNIRRIPYKPKNLIPLNEKITNKNAPIMRSSQVKDNRLVTFLKKQNEQLNKIFTNTVNAAAVNQKLTESVSTFKDSMDSSNCLRLSDKEPSTCTLKPKLTLTHPNKIKEIIFNECPHSPNKENSLKYTNDSQALSSEKITKGTTQMLFNKINSNANSIMNKGPLKPKPRLVTTMPSAATMPKLTTADIKRRLAQYRFPIVVLGKDEISSTVEVFDYEPPQFAGLNKHIWPFMLEWKKKPPAPKRGLPRPIEGIAGNLRKINNELALARYRDKKAVSVDLVSRKNTDYNKRGLQQEITSPSGGQKKVKPMRQFKDKMLKLLYKNTYPGGIQEWHNRGLVKVEPVQDKVDVSTDMSVQEKTTTLDSTMIEPKRLITPKRVGFGEQKSYPKKLEDIIVETNKPCNALLALNMKMPGARHPWAKAKWASDFIDNVMKKIKNGSYYGIEDNKPLTNYDNVNLADKVVPDKYIDNCSDNKEASIQTSKHLSLANKVDFEQNYSENDTYDPFMNIPGFDDALPNFKIKTLNANQIQVKNCLTNVMVHFDVTVPSRSSSHVLNEKSSTSSSFIPLSVTDSNTRIYKCSTTIVNAVLPAELCTVLPTLMRNIFDSDTTLASSTTLPTMTISELSECESEAKSALHRSANHVGNPWLNQYYPPYNSQPHRQNSPCPCSQYNQWMGPHNRWTGPLNPWNGPQNPWVGPQNPWAGAQPWNAQWVPPHTYGWPEYLPMYMSRGLIRLLQGRFGYSLRKHCKRSKSDVIQRIKMKYPEDLILPNTHTKILIALIVNPVKPTTYKETKFDNVKVDKSVEVTESVNCTALELYKPEAKWIPSIGDFTSLVQKMWNYCKFNVHFALPYNVNSNVITFNRDKITVDMIVGDTKKVRIRHVKNFFLDSNHSSNKAKVYEIVESPAKSADYSKDLPVKDVQQLAKKVKERVRRKGYVNLNKKCKPHNNRDIHCTPLSEIANMEDFTLALGAAKSLCSVFDGSSGQKILTCVGELKTWIKEITPSQAFLVLLLANKKDTPNLLRFRPVILQGIAVNRITRATELDMEIEVIERENVQLAEREGIAYIPASVANQDSLFDELCWIAKTTASDYQKPFDESSERLLKALIGKRKKLNPSYLRVMARYVGLGLLKTPTKY